MKKDLVLLGELTIIIKLTKSILILRRINRTYLEITISFLEFVKCLIFKKQINLRAIFKRGHSKSSKKHDCFEIRNFSPLNQILYKVLIYKTDIKREQLWLKSRC
jgi:hypothetical protein